MKHERPIRVCFLIDNVSRGGTESQLLMLLRKLDRKRIMPYLVLLDGANPNAPLKAWEVGKPHTPVALGDVFTTLADIVAVTLRKIRRDKVPLPFLEDK